MRALLDVNMLIALLDAAVVDAARIHDPRRISDVYQLALATRNGGRFVPFVGAVSRDTVPGAGKKHLAVL